MPIITAIVGALAALAGVALTGFITTRNDRLRWEREERVRYHDKRVEAYVAYVRDAGYYAARGSVYVQQPDYDPNVGMPLEIIDAYFAAAGAFQRVRLLASGPVIQTAEEIWRRVREATTDPAVTPLNMPVITTAFFEAARAELGIEIELRAAQE